MRSKKKKLGTTVTVDFPFLYFSNCFKFEAIQWMYSWRTEALSHLPVPCSLTVRAIGLMTEWSVCFTKADMFPVCGSSWKRARRRWQSGPLLCTTGLVMWKLHLPAAKWVKLGFSNRKWPVERQKALTELPMIIQTINRKKKRSTSVWSELSEIINHTFRFSSGIIFDWLDTPSIGSVLLWWCDIPVPSSAVIG